MVLHIDQTLSVWVDQYGAWVYPVLFLIVFAETGLVVLPFLPGDSLLFIAGALGATGKIDPVMLSVLLLIAAVTGSLELHDRPLYRSARVLDEPALPGPGRADAHACLL